MKLLRIIYASILLVALFGCEDVLDKEPTNKLDGDALFSTSEGVKLYMANLYYQLPVEDFTYFRNGFNYNAGGPNNGGYAPAMHTDEAVHSEWGDPLARNQDFHWWTEGYQLIRDVNSLIDAIPDLDVTDDERNLLIGESAFIRAYAYFALVKRYGGVPIISEAQAYSGNVEDLKVPRNTEEETWDFVLTECDKAIANLDDSWPGGERRATKWVAYALKSRVALHAASIAKYWDRAPMSGEAVEKKLVGLNSSLADKYYKECITSSAAIMNSGVFGLYMPNPASPEEAAENYRSLFEDPNRAPEEAIFIKGFALPGNNTGNNYEIWFNPNQVANGWPHPGRMNPTLELADLYEDYTNSGVSSLLKTVADGNEDYVGFDPSKTYIKYDTPNQIFAGKDARLWGTAILPGTFWKGKEIVIQAGYIQPDGTPKLLTKDQIEVNGVVYYTYGAENSTGYSGFDPAGGNHTRTGMSFKKFLNEAVNVIPAWNKGTIDFMDFRYAEILLNYAEAVVESNYSADNAQVLAKNALNDIRQRAAHTDEIDLSLDNVLRERRVELCFENKRFWDLIRRREFHTEFNNRNRHSLLPVLDLREPSPKYIFVRDEVPRYSPQTFQEKSYYRHIVGIETNGLINNPMY